MKTQSQNSPTSKNYPFAIFSNSIPEHSKVWILTHESKYPQTPQVNFPGQNVFKLWVTIKKPTFTIPQLKKITERHSNKLWIKEMKREINKKLKKEKGFCTWERS